MPKPRSVLTTDQAMSIQQYRVRVYPLCTGVGVDGAIMRDVQHLLITLRTLSRQHAQTYLGFFETGALPQEGPSYGAPWSPKGPIGY